MNVTVLTTSRSPGIGSGLTYDAGKIDLKAGSHVLVPLRNSLVEGVVLDVQKKRLKEEFDIKKIQELINEKPLLTSAQLKTLQWMAEYYCCTLRQALSAWLPSPSWRKLTPAQETGYRLINDSAELRGAKQQSVVEFLNGKTWVSKKELTSELHASSATLLSLVKKGILEEVKHKESDEPLIKPSINEPCLTASQHKSYESIKNERRPSLLFGITSSGKTEIYAQLISDQVKKGKQTILLVPEILLTEHCIHRFEELLDREHIAVVHSRLTASQRQATWRKIHQGKVSLVIGSRSALFSPVPNLGLVIIDEEHEWTYKNEQTPRYHARETAQALCRNAKAKLLLGTATPSLESWERAKNGEYHITKLTERYLKKALPDVRIIDLGTVQFGSMYPFSPPLLEAIGERLKRGEQSVLFLNRRGVASSLLCLGCRRRIVSPQSNLPFTLHKNLQGKPYLLDHTSGLVSDVPGTCPSCNSANLLAIGAGTQRIEEILKKKFPNARLLRADRDTLTHPEQMRLLLKKMREGSADILLGTQSVVKGLDLPEVTLAVVLIADIGLSLPHFRAGERIFQLLTQLTGRSGRAKKGEVIIQTFRPDAPEVKLAAQHKTEEYLESELNMRLHTGYPPATKMVRIIISHEASQRAKVLCSEARNITDNLKNDATIHSAPLLFGGGRKWHVLIKGMNPREVVSKLNIKKGEAIDVDPVECV